MADLPPRPGGPALAARYPFTPPPAVAGAAASPPPHVQPSLAYQEVHKRQAQLKSTAWKVWLVLGDCTLIGLAPVLVHLAKDAQGHYAFSPITVNLLVETAKTLFALGTLLTYGTGRPGPPMYRSWRAFVRDAHHNRLLLMPAALYALNNYLKFAMQLFFRPTTAKMLSNLKILVIAVLMRGVMRRTFNVYQWEALLLLVAGITVNQLNYCGKGGADADIFSPLALLYTLGSVTVPSLASVYNEFALKKHMDTSNFFLYLFGVLFNAGGLLLTVAAGGLAPRDVLAGFRPVTVLLVANNALQGILSSFFYKYADTILKKYSSTIATIFTGVTSAALFGHQLTFNFAIGVSIVFISMHLFFSLGGGKGAAAVEPPSRGHPKKAPPQLMVSPSMEHLASLSAVPSSASVTSLASVAEGAEATVPLLRPLNLLPR